MATIATLSEWDFFNRNVQSGLLEGRFMSAAFTLVAAGPPRLASIASLSAQTQSVDLASGASDDVAWPMGVIQNHSVSQNSNIMRLWEIGSERSYFIRGRTVGQIGLGRAMYHGPSLLRAMYAYLRSDQGDIQFPALYENNAQASLNTSGNPGSKDDYKVPPGYENFWIDLSSDVFSQPVGQLMLFRDSNEDTVGAMYAEYCMVTNHSLGTDSSGTIISESAAILYERLLPIDVQAVALIRNSTDIRSIITGAAVGSAA